MFIRGLSNFTSRTFDGNNLFSFISFDPKILNKLIVYDKNININDFLNNMIDDAMDKEDYIRNVIREESGKKEDYLNKFLYLLSGKENLTSEGWNEFETQKLGIVFRDISRDFPAFSTGSHTCDGLNIQNFQKRFYKILQRLLLK